MSFLERVMALKFASPLQATLTENYPVLSSVQKNIQQAAQSLT